MGTSAGVGRTHRRPWLGHEEGTQVLPAKAAWTAVRPRFPTPRKPIGWGSRACDVMWGGHGAVPMEGMWGAQ